MNNHFEFKFLKWPLGGATGILNQNSDFSENFTIST